MIDQIYESILAHGPTDHNKGRQANTKNNNIFTNLFLPVVKNMEDLSVLTEMVKNGESQRIANYPLSMVAEALKEVSNS